MNAILNETVRAITERIKKRPEHSKAHNCYIHDKEYKATPRPVLGSPTVELENVSGIEGCV